VTPPAAQPDAAEISGLIAWMRRLSDAGVRQAGPAELAAFQNAKKDLLARIERCRPHDQPGDPVD
jgi:hypothetical protein